MDIATIVGLIGAAILIALPMISGATQWLSLMYLRYK